jgi:NCS2 family nucleobase:cation symporter-2
MLMFILGLQQCVKGGPRENANNPFSALAMVGGLVVPPLLFGGSSGANLGTEAQQYLISACLIWSSFGSVLQISRHKIWKTKYYIGTGIISVTGTSFAFAGVALKYLQQSVSGIFAFLQVV